MIYDLSQPHLNGASQATKQLPYLVGYQEPATVKTAMIERLIRRSISAQNALLWSQR